MNLFTLSLLITVNCISFSRQSSLRPEGASTNGARIRRQTRCGLNEFKCKSGECVSTLDLCDNIPNCKDSSDETAEVCAGYECPKFTYKCAYGSCIFAGGRCDGKNDCLDNSDEDDCHPTTVASIVQNVTADYCFLPEPPANGFLYVDGDDGRRFRLGDKVPDGANLTFKCVEKHLPYPNNAITCSKRQWSGEVPKCERVCEPIDVYHLILKCYRGGQVVDCDPAFNGTNAKATCTRFHENMNVIEQRYAQCVNGKWTASFGLCADANSGYLIPPYSMCDERRFFTCSTYVTDDQEQCVDLAAKCDGKFDCWNRVDETNETCSKFVCPSHKFRCDYGGCVHSKARCNGIKECFDNSDEEGCPPIVLPCILPEPPANGLVTVQAVKAPEYKPGDEVPQGTALIYKCRFGYDLLDGANINYCIGGKWLTERPKCEKTCPPINQTKQMEAKCYRGENVVDCSKPFAQTRARLQCARYHEDPSLVLLPYRYCLDGEWDKNLPNCVPECGQKFVKPQALIIGGQVSKKDHWPWVVGIYYKRDKQHICGGSLINQKVIVSAAHCFSDGSDRLLAPETFAIAAGKHYRRYDHVEDVALAQYSDVANIYVPKEYRGVDQNYRADIAVVALKETFVLTINVRPVCIDWGPTFEGEQYSNQRIGIVLGWGLTAEGGAPSDELKELDVPYRTQEECLERLDDNYRRFATTGDKICGGYVNKSTSACQGDSGGGYVFRRGDRYYLRGIVSVAPKSAIGSCDSNQYTLFTQVSKYDDFVSKYAALHRPF